MCFDSRAFFAENASVVRCDSPSKAVVGCVEVCASVVVCEEVEDSLVDAGGGVVVVGVVVVCGSACVVSIATELSGPT